MTQIACDVIDKLLCTEMRRRGKWRGFKWTLYELARGASDLPLVMAAAEKLNGRRRALVSSPVRRSPITCPSVKMTGRLAQRCLRVR